jgi:hypothetical protein
MIVPQRNFTETDLKQVAYNGSSIKAWIKRYEQKDLTNDTWNSVKQIKCHIFRKGSSNQPLNLHECNNGDKFTSVNQAINQAKKYIDCCEENDW